MKTVETSLEKAFSDAQEIGVGIATDFGRDLLHPLQELAEPNPASCWQELEADEFTEELLMLQGLLKSQATLINPASNMGFVHIIHRIKGTTNWHYDVSEDDAAATGYKKGRFRAGLNLYGNVELGFEDPSGVRHWQAVRPGDLYVLDYAHNPYHGARPSDEASTSMFASKVLLLTDVARYSGEL